MSFLGISKLESSADGVFMKEEDVDKMAALHGYNEQLKSDLKTANDAFQNLQLESDVLKVENEDLKNQVLTLTAEKHFLTNKVATLEAAPAAAPSAVQKDKDDVSSTAGEDKERKKTAAEEKRDRMAQINEFDITKARLED